MALSKWITRRNSFREIVNDTTEEEEAYLRSLFLRTRIESQDAWIFQTPIPKSIAQTANFELGSPRCDNAVASIFFDNGFKVINPSIFIRAIEIDTKGRKTNLYSPKGGLLQRSRWVLFSDHLEF